MSLTITATRRPSRLFRMWFSKVVLPAPRKPDRTVTGSFAVMGKQERERVILICYIITKPDLAHQPGRRRPAPPARAGPDRAPPVLRTNPARAAPAGLP